LARLPEAARAVFAELVASFDDESAAVLRVGYEVPFYAGHVDAGRLARELGLSQREVDDFQETLADALLLRVHEVVPDVDEPLSRHVTEVVEQALAALEHDSALLPVIRSRNISLQGVACSGTRAAFERLVSAGDVVRRLDASPQVRLHGDFFLENVLWRREGEGAQLLLIDPVSVAGVAQGPPLFDLVKYESYATGELFALRAGLVEVSGFEKGDDYRSRVCWEAPALTPFRERNWHARFRRRFEARYGAVDRQLAHLLDGYFSLAMAVNTQGAQQRARLLKATSDFNRAADA
jgi:hypothetical protein